MQRNYKHETLLNRWMTTIFASIPSAHIRIDLLFTAQYTDKLADATATAKIFRNHLNQHFCGKKARRFGKDEGLKVMSVFHRENLWQQPHIHILCEIPKEKTIEDLDAFLQKFARKQPYINKRYSLQETRNTEASVFYNTRFGAETILDI